MTGIGRITGNLPRTVEDAITVTKNLDYRYLWVDELCIEQNDSSHRASQIGKMDRIYKGADLTIVAACGDNKNYGLPGVSTTSRIIHPVIHLEDGSIFNIGPEPGLSIRESPWWDRAW